MEIVHGKISTVKQPTRRASNSSSKKPVQQRPFSRSNGGTPLVATEADGSIDGLFDVATQRQKEVFTTLMPNKPQTEQLKSIDETTLADLLDSYLRIQTYKASIAEAYKTRKQELAKLLAEKENELGLLRSKMDETGAGPELAAMKVKYDTLSKECSATKAGAKEQLAQMNKDKKQLALSITKNLSVLKVKATQPTGPKTAWGP
ncbi:hypothetical protein COO60DRAFT_1643780 [Scenedesmus sp. NREL 46B-D3]|nr:hypothetical protein COO60DRAFT_1643780 [Scenedesmus sp. NREL 46B-D3]